MVSAVISKLRTFLIETIRVFKITKKPSKEEFKVISKVTGVGTIVIGLIGFTIQMLYFYFL